MIIWNGVTGYSAVVGRGAVGGGIGVGMGVGRWWGGIWGQWGRFDGWPREMEEWVLEGINDGAVGSDDCRPPFL